MSTYSWGRLYGEWADDIKVQSMSEVDQRRHAMLFCMHIKGHTDPTNAEVALQLRISEKSWKKTQKIFIEKGFLGDDGNHLINWERRQYKSDKSAERTRDYRSRKKGNDADVTSQGLHSDGEGDGLVTPSEYRAQSTETEEEELPPTRAVDADVVTMDQVLKLYAAVLPMLPPVQVVGPMMSYHVRLSLENFPDRRKPEFWQALFTKARISDLKRGVAIRRPKPKKLPWSGRSGSRYSARSATKTAQK